MGYIPTDSVRAAHNIPHLSLSLTTSSNDFRSVKDNFGTYFLSVLLLPIVLLSLGLFSLLLYQMALNCRVCRIKRFGPSIEHVDRKHWMMSESFRVHPRLFSLFVIFLGLVVIADNIIFYGNEKLKAGIEEGGNSLEPLAGFFSDIAYNGNAMRTNGQGMHGILDGSYCTDLPSSTRSSLKAFIDGYTNAAGAIYDLIGHLPENILEIRDSIKANGQDKASIVLFGYYAAIMTLVLFLLLNGCCRSKYYLGFCIMMSELIVSALTVLACIEMIVVTILGDFCIAPSSNVLALTPAGSLYDVMKYYMTCEGSNPFTGYASNSTSYAERINATLADTPKTPGTELPQCVASLYLQLRALDVLITDLIHDMECGRLFDFWTKAVNVSICSQSFDGLFAIWISHFVTAGCLFFVLIVLSFFYDLYAEGKPTETEANGNRKNDGENGDRKLMEEEAEKGAELSPTDDVLQVNSSFDYICTPRGSEHDDIESNVVEEELDVEHQLTGARNGNTRVMSFKMTGHYKEEVTRDVLLIEYHM